MKVFSLGPNSSTTDNAGDKTLDEIYSYSPSGSLLSRTRIGAYIHPNPAAIRPYAATQIRAKTIDHATMTPTAT
ncbi:MULTISPECIES: hypothetical protein [unclassified Rhizobium]|uniref:hypothetical protein n=1 Tax=unclassified Rhizobium TaxID=2613769 RepID=UPI001C82C463|nr:MULTISPECIES: hypothetical protein [unclassified Rhizobium]MBX5217829.1 hypothetical protein [Rhizobium sp. NLR9a]MBX5221630.1 hypothetical protein [Rhizobium sp. NLR8a]MBX5244865.1 hypothetical protein [Rhizobium sp. NLR3b]MBX5268653.1 hypothetical protein [Rhizobium sp. NLR17b]MBX5276690.1 hypothetical protein [Rhizobium sp. NLR13a]